MVKRPKIAAWKLAEAYFRSEGVFHYALNPPNVGQAARSVCGIWFVRRQSDLEKPTCTACDKDDYPND